MFAGLSVVCVGVIAFYVKNKLTTSTVLSVRDVIQKHSNTSGNLGKLDNIKDLPEAGCRCFHGCNALRISGQVNNLETKVYCRIRFEADSDQRSD